MDSLDPACIAQPSLTFLLTWFCDFSCLFLSSIRRIKGPLRSSPGMSIMDSRSPLGTDRCKLTFPCSKVRGQLWAWGSQQYCEWADRIHSLNWSSLWAWPEKFGWFCTHLCENASCSSPPQLTWEWNQCGDLDLSAQEQVVWTGRLKPVLFVLFILKWGGSKINWVC